jgi:hypothetical protein
MYLTQDIIELQAAVFIFKNLPIPKEQTPA